MSFAARSSAKAGRIIGDDDVRAYQQRRGDKANVDDYLSRQLDQGAGLSRQVVKFYNDPASEYFTPQQRLTRFATKTAYGTPGDLAEGLAAAGDIGKGNVYLGSTAPRNPGGSPSPGGNGYNAIVAPRWMVKGAAGGASKPQAQSAAPAPTEAFAPSPDLIAAQTEAKDRAQQWLGSGSSAAGAASGTGVGTGNIYADIYALGAGQVNDYKERFLPSLTADAMLQARETAAAMDFHLGQLSPDVEPPDVLSWKQIKDQTKWSGRFATKKA